ncbi:MAG: biotin synthase BioB [Deltaproteobacteria bacterium]|nr:biotin synthase BioB [Deltaproteobacteria bacterium]
MDQAQHSSVTPRHDWTEQDVADIYHQPLLDLVYQAAAVHRAVFPAGELQMCALLSVKTGKCSEDCGYCAQSAHHHAAIEPESLKAVDEVLARAGQAKAQGATRFCMAAAWRGPRDPAAFESVLDMVRGIRALGMEACASLGELSEGQAERLAEAGLNAYNHNLDTGPAFYPQVTHTHTFDQRLATIRRAAGAGIGVCAGGIIGLGESPQDRVALLHILATLRPHPESVPVNALVPVEGTPLAGRPPVDPMDLVRVIATARLLMPATNVRLSAGRLTLSPEAQALAFLAGANSIFTGEKLLTTPNTGWNTDRSLMERLGLSPRPARYSSPTHASSIPAGT